MNRRIRLLRVSPNLRRLTASRIVCAWRSQLPGLHGVYDQGTHRAQKRAALKKWEAKLLSIVREKFSAAKTIVTEIECRHRRTRA